MWQSGKGETGESGLGVIPRAIDLPDSSDLSDAPERSEQWLAKAKFRACGSARRRPGVARLCRDKVRRRVTPKQGFRYAAAVFVLSLAEKDLALRQLSLAEPPQDHSWVLR